MFERFGKVGADLLALAGLRVELFGVELREQFEAWVRVAALAVAAVVLACVGLGFLAVLVAVAFWDSHPIAALGACAAVFVLGAYLCLRALVSAASTAASAFPETIAEFRRDREALERLREPPQTP